MTDNEEMYESDVNTESSSDTEEQTEQLTDSSQESVSQEAAPEPKQKEIPFHEHPRFQELVSEKNQYKSEIQALAKRLQDMESKSAANVQPKKDELMERLQGIDPVFAERFGKLNEVDQLKQELQEFKQWREQASQQQVQTQIQSTKDKFYADNSVPEERRSIYEALVAQQAASDPSLKITDLPKVMKAVHDNIGKMFQNVERSTTKNFVDSKRAQASKPATQSRGIPAKAVKQESNLSMQDIREAIRAEALAEARANKE